MEAQIQSELKKIKEKVSTYIFYSLGGVHLLRFFDCLPPTNPPPVGICEEVSLLKLGKICTQLTFF